MNFMIGTPLPASGLEDLQGLIEEMEQALVLEQLERSWELVRGR